MRLAPGPQAGRLAQAVCIGDPARVAPPLFAFFAIFCLERCCVKNKLHVFGQENDWRLGGEDNYL